MIEPLLAKEAAEHALEGAAMKLLELYDLIGLQPEMILEASKRVPSQECCTLAAVSGDPGASDMLTGLL